VRLFDDNVEFLVDEVVSVNVHVDGIIYRRNLQQPADHQYKKSMSLLVKCFIANKDPTTCKSISMWMILYIAKNFNNRKFIYNHNQCILGWNSLSQISPKTKTQIN